VRLVVVGVHHQHVAAFRRERLGAVADLHGEALAVRRQREVGACGRHDARIELDHADPGLPQVPEEELGKRAAAKADHQRAARLGMEQQESHHATGVVERQREGIAEPHRALDRLAADVQRAHPALVADRYGGQVLFQDPP